MTRRRYATRSSAVAAARRACRKALNAPHYQAKEGPDYIIFPMADGPDFRSSYYLSEYEGPSGFELCGPAAIERKEGR